MVRAGHGPLASAIAAEPNKTQGTAMQSQRKLVQTSLIPIRWGDMDAYGHVNNTVYFRYMEQARVEYLEKLGFKVMPRARRR
jgi:acyl-ACP thioesterase